MIQISEKEFYEMRKRAGLCPKCGREDAYTMAGRVMCAECAEKARIKAERRRKDPDKRETMYNSVKSIKHARKADGLCPECGGKPVDGRVRCVSCTIKSMAYKRKCRGGPIPRGEYGVCWTCNRESALPGKRLCKSCYDKACRNLINSPSKRGD